MARSIPRVNSNTDVITSIGGGVQLASHRGTIALAHDQFVRDGPQQQYDNHRELVLIIVSCDEDGIARAFWEHIMGNTEELCLIIDLRETTA